MALWRKFFSPWFAFPTLGVVFYGALFLPVRSPACGCAKPPSSMLGVLKAGQKLYFIKHGNFTDDFNKLIKIVYGETKSSDIAKSHLSLPSSRFRYEIDAQPDRVVMYGILKQEAPSDFLGIGIVKQKEPNMIVAMAADANYFKTSGELKTVSIECEGMQNSLSKPNPPSYDGAKFICPEGYKELKF